jgi:hypothetical protein
MRGRYDARRMVKLEDKIKNTPPVEIAGDEPVRIAGDETVESVRDSRKT